MLNDRDNDDDNKYEGHEESEYHFSEDDVSYEVETETPKSAPASKEPKESLTAKLGRSKRMLISGSVFLVLVFVVYKMVSPTATIQSTDITPPSLAQQSAITTKPAAAPATVATTPAVVTPPPAAMAVAPAPPATSSTTAAMISPAATTPTVPASVQPAATTTAQAPVAPTDQLSDGGPSLMTGMPANAITSGSAPTQTATTTTTTAGQPAATTGLPAVIPVQSNMANTTGTPAQQPQVVTDSALAAIQANNEKLVSQMAAQYEQKLNDYQVQNKALQSQVDTLTSKVSTMQGQLGDLVKALTRAQAAAAAAPPPDAIPPPSADRVGSAGSSGYNVQAIIPGRAWLRSDAGDTVTVAEGDVIRGLGKVTKIDPYDGVVVINTGMKTLSLSYGNGS